MYVDDIFIVCDSDAIESCSLNALRGKVTVKFTGHICQDVQGGGTITFADRAIRRWPNCKGVEVLVRESYLEPFGKHTRLRGGHQRFRTLHSILSPLCQVQS